MTGFERLSLAEHVAKAVDYLGERIGRKEAILEACDCLDDETLERVFEHMMDTVAEGMA